MGFVIPYPLINGHRFSFASIELVVNNLPFVGATSVNYSDELDPADVYGTDSQKLGRTRGKRQSSADMEMYKLEWELLRKTLGIAGVGYGETSFDIVVSYSEGLAAPVITDLIRGCRITKVEMSNSEGNEATKVKLSMNVMDINLSVTDSIAAPISLGG